MFKTLKSAALALVCALTATAAIAATPTTNYSWLKPTVGADANAWGTDINSDFDGIDSIVFGIQGTANAACPKAGCTLTGKLTVGASTASGALFNFQPGVAPSSPVNGDLWGTSSGLFSRINGATQQVAFLTSNVASATNATTVGGVGLSGLVQNNGGTYGINISGNANFVGGVGIGGLVQNNSQTYSINITGSAGSAGSANTANTANYANSAGSLSGQNCNPSAGYCYIAGWMHEWGLTTSIVRSLQWTFNLPTSCPSGVNANVVAVDNTGGTNGVSVLSTSSSTFTLRNNKSITSDFYWTADCY